MLHLKFLAAFAIAALLLAGTGSGARAAGNIMYILDVSGSMAAKLDGKRKINLAKDSFNLMIDGLPADTHAGLYVYGHHGDRDCQAFEMLLPPGLLDRGKMKQAVKGVSARRGATPLTAALAKSVEAIANYKQPGKKAVVLLSDGEENCGGDPVAFAAQMGKALGDLVKVYVVGFDVGKKEREQLEAVAKAMNGAYFDAGNARELTAALNKVASQVVKTSIFEDDFDAAFLNEAWDILGDSADNRTLSDGKFVAITEPGSLSTNTAKNVLLYKDKIEERNYDVSVKLTADYQAYGGTYGDSPDVRTNAGLILHESKDNFLTLHLVNLKTGYSDKTGPYAFFVKRHRAKESKPLKLMLRGGAPLGEATAHFRIEKRGFKYTAFVSKNGKKWIKIGTHALLGKTLRPGLFAIQGGKAVEAIVEFDRFEIQKVKK